MDSLDKLAANPHIKLTPAQLKLLKERRRQRAVRHTTSVPKHDTHVKKHNPQVEKEDHGKVS